VRVAIDETHNACPSLADSRLAGLTDRRTVQIAGEGRRFGLHLLISTQRPQKVRENVLSQWDNLVLMRMNSTSDLAHLGSVFSLMAAGLLPPSSGFGLGEALAAGKISPRPALLRFGTRITEQGGPTSAGSGRLRHGPTHGSGQDPRRPRAPWRGRPWSCRGGGR